MKKALVATLLCLGAFATTGCPDEWGYQPPKDTTEQEFRIWMILNFVNNRPCPRTQLTEGVSYGPFTRAQNSGCFVITTTGPRTIALTTSGNDIALISFLGAPGYTNSGDADDPTASIPNAATVPFNVSAADKTQLTVIVN